MGKSFQFSPKPLVSGVKDTKIIKPLKNNYNGKNVLHYIILHPPVRILVSVANEYIFIISDIYYIWYLLYLIFLYVILTQWIVQYVNQKYNSNYLSLSHILDDIYIMYSPYLYMCAVIIYICYLSIIMGYNLIHDICNWVEYVDQQVKNIIWNVQREMWNNGYDYMLDGTHITNITNQDQPEITSKNIYGIIEKTAGIVVNNTSRIGAYKKFCDFNSGQSMFPPLPEGQIPSLHINRNTHSHLMEREQFLHDKILLHEFKKTYPQYSNKELIFIDNLPFKGYKQKLNLPTINLCDLKGVPDTLIYDKNDGTYTTMQFKSSLGNNFTNFQTPDFLQKYNHTTHVMQIMLEHAGKFEQIYEIMKQQNIKFDTWIYVNPQTIDIYIDEQLIREVDAADHKFMDRIGYQVKHDFYNQYVKEDFSKFKSDIPFTYNLYKYSQTFIYEWQISTYLTGNNKHNYDIQI